METRIVELADGRELAWSEAGVASGPVVFGFHGTPGSGQSLLVETEVFAAAGVRFIAPDRPGYGHSSFHPGRTLRDWCGDVVALAGHLGVERFTVLGVSGGGPHAAVCARFLADRVAAAAIVSGIGPIAEPGSEAGMMPMNKLLARASRRAPSAVRVPLGLLTRIGRRFPDKALEVARRHAPAPDAEALARPEVAAAFLRDLTRPSPTSSRAAAQDFALFSRDWGFRLEDIDVPVHVWQGEADVNVPPAHGSLQAARIPGAVLHRFPDEGHLVHVMHAKEILVTLTGAARP